MIYLKQRFLRICEAVCQFQFKFQITLNYEITKNKKTLSAGGYRQEPPALITHCRPAVLDDNRRQSSPTTGGSFLATGTAGLSLPMIASAGVSETAGNRSFYT